MAHALVGAFHLPPEIVNADPLASEVSGQAAVRFSGLPGPLDASIGYSLGPDMMFVPAGVVVFDTPVARGRAFTGFLDLPRVTPLPGHRLRSDPAHSQLSVVDDTGAVWHLAAQKPIAGALLAIAYRPPSGNPVHAITLRWGMGPRRRQRIVDHAKPVSSRNELAA